MGVPHSDPAALQLAKDISETEGVELTGIYAHCGNTYGCKGEVEIKAVAQETTNIVLQFVKKYAYHALLFRECCIVLDS